MRNYKGGPHRVSKKSADFRCRKRTLWTWRGAAPIVIERSEKLETLPLYIAKVEGCKGATFQGRKQNLYSFLFTLQKLHLCTLIFLYLFFGREVKEINHAVAPPKVV